MTNGFASTRIAPFSRPAKALALMLVAAAFTAQTQAYVVTITQGDRAVYLQVGAGSLTGTDFNSGGTPLNNATVNMTSVTVPATAIGSGTAQTMLTDSPVTASPYDSFQFCTSPGTTGQVYVGGFYRGRNSNPSTATLSVSTVTPLTSPSGATIPFTQIAWTSSGNSDNTATIPSGTFTGAAAQPIYTVTRNTWFESCLAFRYLNAQFRAAGTFTGRATFTLSTP